MTVISSLERLPLELHYAIIDKATDLLPLRGVNKCFWTVVTPLAFRLLVVHNTRKHAEGLRNLQEYNALTVYVEEIALEYLQDEERLWREMQIWQVSQTPSFRCLL